MRPFIRFVSFRGHHPLSGGKASSGRPLTAGRESPTIRAMKVLVTGGTGFIGRHLLDHLRSREDVETFALVRDPRRLEGRREGPRFRVLRGRSVLPSRPCRPALDVVFHLAGLTKCADAKDYYTVNAEGTASLVRLSSPAGPEAPVWSTSAAWPRAGRPDPGDPSARTILPVPSPRTAKASSKRKRRP